MDTNKYIPQIEGDGSAMREHMRNLNKTIESLTHENYMAVCVADMLATWLAVYMANDTTMGKDYQRAETAMRQYEMFKENR